MASGGRGKPLRDLEAMMLRRMLTKVWERLKVRREEVEGRSKFIEGLPNNVVESKIWPCLRKVYKINERSQDEK